ncbi:MAG TPA: GntR family transcriptional regulator, partial [Polyangiaceae bacterium]
RIAELIAAEIHRGRLRAGDRLPGSRSLAQQLGVGRNTVVAAYAELVSEGWITTERAGGSFVSSELPELKTRRFGARQSPEPRLTPGFDFVRRAFASSLDSGAAFSLYGGVPDLRLFPTTAFARASPSAPRQGAQRARLRAAIR